MTHSRKLGAVAVTALWNPFVLMALPNAPRVAAAMDEKGSRRLDQGDLSSGQEWAMASGDNGSSAGSRFEEKQLEGNLRSEPSKGTGEDAALVRVEDETASASNEVSRFVVHYLSVSPSLTYRSTLHFLSAACID